MIIYTGALFWILLLCVISSGRNFSLDTRQKVRAGAAFLAMFYIVFFTGLRSAGGDTAAYIKSYRKAAVGYGNALAELFSLKEESLFNAYEILMKTIFGNRYEPYLFGIAALSGFAIAWCLYKYSDGYFTSMLLFVLWGYWSWMSNGVRQFLAVALCFMCLPLVAEQKKWQYFACVFIISRIHTSALLMIPVYFAVQGDPLDRRTAVAVLVTLLALVFTSRFLGIVQQLLGDSKYADEITSDYFTQNDGSSVIRTAIYAVPTLLALTLREEIEKKAPPLIKVCVGMSIICVCCSAVGNVTSGIYFGRVPIFFSVYNLILIPWLFVNTKMSQGKGWPGFIMLFYTAYFVYSNYVYAHPYYSSDYLGLMLR